MSEDEEAPIVLPMVPAPILTPDEKAALAKAMGDPQFWEAFVKLPEPPD